MDRRPQGERLDSLHASGVRTQPGGLLGNLDSCSSNGALRFTASSAAAR
jgi:hypothetical protein